MLVYSTIKDLAILEPTKVYELDNFEFDFIKSAQRLVSLLQKGYFDEGEPIVIEYLLNGMRVEMNVKESIFKFKSGSDEISIINDYISRIQKSGNIGIMSNDLILLLINARINKWKDIFLENKGNIGRLCLKDGTFFDNLNFVNESMLLKKLRNYYMQKLDN